MSREHYKRHGHEKGGPVKPPAHMGEYLQHARFPARKQSLVHQAEDNAFPVDVIRVLKRLPDREYLSVQEVIQHAEEEHG